MFTVFGDQVSRCMKEVAHEGRLQEVLRIVPRGTTLGRWGFRVFGAWVFLGLYLPTA